MSRRSATFVRSVSTVFQSLSSRCDFAVAPTSCAIASPVRLEAVPIVRTSVSTSPSRFAARAMRSTSRARDASGISAMGSVA